MKGTKVAPALNPTITTELEDRGRPTRIAVELSNGRARIRTLDQGYYLAGRPLRSSGNRVCLALVGIRLALLAGDGVDVRIHVGAGVVLEVIEPTGMVAYDAGGDRSTWTLTATVEAGATLIWQGAAFVAAQGSNACRTTKIVLGSGARAVLKETLILGRSGEFDVRLYNQTQALLEARELLVEELALTPEARRLPGISGDSKVIGTVTALGRRPSEDVVGTQRLDLAGPGALWRSLCPAAHLAERAIIPVFKRWRAEALQHEGTLSG